MSEQCGLFFIKQRHVVGSNRLQAPTNLVGNRGRPKFLEQHIPTAEPTRDETKK